MLGLDGVMRMNEHYCSKRYVWRKEDMIFVVVVVVKSDLCS